MAEQTHRLVKEPRMTAKELADFMVASETARRTLVRNCKFRPIARVTQHNLAKQCLSKFFREGRSDVSGMHAEEDRLRSMLVDSEFERDLYDHNADYISRFAAVYDQLEFPSAEILAQGAPVSHSANGVKVNADLQFRLRRLTKTNKVKVGAGVFRYTKGKAVQPEAAAYHAAFVFGVLGATAIEPDQPEEKLCLVIDAYAGKTHPAPTDSTRRFGNMQAACATIAERWPNVAPPDGAVY